MFYMVREPQGIVALQNDILSIWYLIPTSVRVQCFVSHVLYPNHSVLNIKKRVP